ncbi:MAG: membrane protein insertase YidC [Treponema sp.]|nr:membrane protein insertase YidC [Treponema sp.]
MEKRTVLAIVLCSLVMVVTLTLQTVLAPPPPPVDTQIQQPPANEWPHDFTPSDQFDQPHSQVQDSQLTHLPGTQPVQDRVFSVVPVDEFIPLNNNIIIETDLIRVRLTNAGGEITAFQWIDQRRSPGDPARYVDLILPGDNQAHPAYPARFFALTFDGAEPVSAVFHVNQSSEYPYRVEFYRDFLSPAAVHGSDGRFRLTKRFDFFPGEYLFEFRVMMDGGFGIPGFNFGGNAYTLSFGPQIGPSFERLDRFYDFRNFSFFIDGRISRDRDIRLNERISRRPEWLAISGKYFAFIANPVGLTEYSFMFSDRRDLWHTDASRLYIFRPGTSISSLNDLYRFYIGPRTLRELSRHNTGLSTDPNFHEVASTRGFFSIFSPLERLLKWMLDGFYGIIPNYGVAIILLTLLIKILFFPLTKKGSEATLRMQALAPKIKELQEKYKNNKQKLQMEMANFYKQEGYNPLAGCLPMLLQMPIFITMFQLFNNDFELRGAMFIPGWIPDLSLPEYIVQWTTPLPLLGWTALRVLPFIYVASQLLYGKVTQMPGQQSANQMKFMLFAMPIIFFFVLYNVPSGLLIYWIFSNLLTLVQQLFINKYVIKKRKAAAELAAANAGTSPSASSENKQAKTQPNFTGKKKKKSKK